MNLANDLIKPRGGQGTSDDQLALLEALGVQEGGGSKIDWKPMVAALLRHGWIIILSIGVGLGIAAAYLHYATRVYESRAVLQVESRMASPVLISGAEKPEDAAGEMIRTVLKSFDSRELMRRVAASLAEQKVPGFSADELAATGQTESDVIAQLLRDKNVVVEPGTRLIVVAFKARDPEVARIVTSTMVEQFRQASLERRIASSKENVDYLLHEKEQLAQALRKSEEELSSYVESQRALSADGTSALVEQQLRSIVGELGNARAMVLKLESDLDQVTAAKNDPERLLEVTSITNQKPVSESLARISQLENEIARLQLRYKDKHPKMIEQKMQLDRERRTLDRNLVAAAGQLNRELTAARRNIELLEATKETLERQVKAVSRQSIESKVIERQIEADRLAYEAALRRLNEELSQARSQPVSIQVVDVAQPGYLLSPSSKKAFGLGGLGGAMLGCAIVALLFLTDRTLKSAGQAEEALRLPVLASIPRVTGPRESGHAWVERAGWVTSTPLIDDHFGISSDAFRILRVSLLLNSAMTGAKNLLVASPFQGDGKSFCAVNLAIALAQQGSRTLLIDADLRKAAINRRAGIGGAEPGLTEVLLGNCSLMDAIQGTAVTNLSVLSGGSPAGEPHDILGQSDLFAQMLRECEATYDWVVVDSAALDCVSDTMAIARHFPLCVVVVRHGRTPQPAIANACEQLRRAGCQPTGIILNDVPLSQFGRRRLQYYGRYRKELAVSS